MEVKPMKVNIIGKFPGQTVNGIGILPRRGIEMTEAEVQRLLNFPNIRVFDAASGGLLTKDSFNVKKTVQSVTTKAKEQPAPVVEQKIEPVTPVVATPETEIKAEPIPPTEAEPYTEPEVTVEETAVEEIAEEASPVVEETVVEEKPVEEKPYQKYNKNKGKNNRRHFDNQHTDKE
jgi:hypothetical protein